MNSDKTEESRIFVGFEQKALFHGDLIPLQIDFRAAPHLLIVASSGSGKTYLLALVLRQLAEKKADLVFADFKGIDFTGLEGCRNYYRHNAVADALNRIFEELQRRMANPHEEFPPLYFCIDEWSGFLGLYPKKEQEHFKQQLASILMLGRGLLVFAVIAMQRADAAFISGRDNIGNCIGLGSLSRESLNMTFGDCKDVMLPKGRGKGYLKTDGKPLRELSVPRIRDYGKKMAKIRAALE